MKKHDTSIQGIYAADEALFILTKDAIYAAKLGQKNSVPVELLIYLTFLQTFQLAERDKRSLG